MSNCPYCNSSAGQVRAGLSNGIQRFKCQSCKRRYSTPDKPRRYPGELRLKAIALRDQGMKIRQIARAIGVNHQSVANWIAAARAAAPAASPPASEELSRPKRRPTISDVARQAGISVATVSNYLNDKGRMAQSTRARIESAMEDLHFAPSALVRALRQQRTGIIGVLIFGLRLMDREVGVSLTPPLLSGIAERAEEAEYNLLLYTGWTRTAVRREGREFLNGHIDGLIWVDPLADSPALKRISEARLPTVALLTRDVPENVGYVNCDNFGAMRLLVEHLVERGHRRIAYVGPDSGSNFVDRHSGYRRAVEQLGCDKNPLLQVAIGYEERTVDRCAAALAPLLALPSPPTAIMCSDDLLASLMGDAIQQRGLRIPDDLAVTGFDDIPIAPHICGGLTTIRQPFAEMGRLAAESLLRMITGKQADCCRMIVHADLIIRNSTANAAPN